MPTVAELERLQALIERLKPLANVQRGEIIRAEDWNSAIGVLMEVARAIVTTERDTAVPTHQHSDQISIGWLDPTLRSLIERGPLADPASVTKLTNLERDLLRSVAQLDKFNGDVREVRDRVSDISSRDLVRESSITEVRRKIEGLSDAREGVLDLRRTLDTIRKDVETAVKVGQQLTVNGQPVDMNQFNQRLTGLEELRARLTNPNGQILDANALEIRFSELQNQFVTEEELDEALKNRVADLNPDQLGSLQATLSNELTQKLNSSLEGFQGNIRDEVAASLSQIEAIASRAVSDAIPGVRESLRGELQTELTKTVDTRLEQEQARVNKLVEGSAASVSKDFEVKLSDLSNTLPDLISDVLKKQFPSLIRSVLAELKKLEEHVAEIEARLRELEDRRKGFNETVFRDNILGEMATRQDTAIKEVRGQLSELETGMKTQIDSMSTATSQPDPALLQKIAGEAVASQIREATTQLQAQMRGIVQDELASVQQNLQAGLNRQLESSLAAFERKITESLRSLVRRELTAGVQEMVKAEMQTSLEKVLPQTLNRQLEQFTPRFVEIIDKRLDERLR